MNLFWAVFSHLEPLWYPKRVKIARLAGGVPLFFFLHYGDFGALEYEKVYVRWQNVSPLGAVVKLCRLGGWGVGGGSTYQLAQPIRPYVELGWIGCASLLVS